MRFVRDIWDEYDHIEGGKRYRNSEEAKSDALANPALWFPNADSLSLFVFEDENLKGSWMLQANYMTATGPRAIDIQFEDFRPTKRIDTPHAKESICQD